MRKIVVALILAVVLATGAWWFFTRPDSMDSKTADQAQTTENTADTMALLVSELQQQHPDVAIGVSVANLQDNQTYHWGDDAPFGSASVAKLITAAAAFDQIEDGDLDGDTKIDGYTVSEDLKKLIEESDNDAWQRLNDHLGTEALESYAESVGVTSYAREGQTVTSDDIALLLTKLYQGELLNANHTDQLLEFMKNANYAQYIPEAIPESLTVYHKAGFLEDRVHDAAVIADDDRAIVLVIFTKGGEDYSTDTAQGIIHQVTDTAIDTFLQ